MAYAALVSLAQTLKQVQVEDCVQVLFGGTKEHESLHENIMRLVKFLEEFPEEHAPAVRPLEEATRDAAYELEDHIERYVTLSDKFLHESTDNEKNTSLITLKDTLHKHIEGVKSLIEHVGSILEVATEVKNAFTAEDSSIRSDTSSSASGSSRHEPSEQEKLVGVRNDLIQIMDRVTGYESNLQIIPIVGTGGIGKTTLARNVYSDLLIEQHFDVRHWATVSQEFRVREVLQGLLCKEGEATEHAETLIERVYKNLKNRRYLFVLDDMWHDEVWDRVRRAFPDDNNGSRIIITTRLSDVASAVDSLSPLHRMEFLNEDQSWDLLRERVYGQEHCPRQLEEVGKLIARNCKGLPLTIVVIAGLLKVNKTKDYWASVAKNINEAIATNDDKFFAILSLSYDNLPHHLKACFLYMGIFPEDYMIPANKLIKLWVAEGFLKPSRSENLEEVAEEYLVDLVNRNLVLVTKKRSNGGIKFCGIHDVLRELSIKRGQDEIFFQHYKFHYTSKSNLVQVPNIQRRWIIHTSVGSYLDNIQISPTSTLVSPIRSLLYIYGHDIGILPSTPQFCLLRVLDGLKIRLKCLPDEIFDLVNLMYLALTFDYSYTSCFPARVTRLKNLETLITNDPYGYTSPYSMSSEIWKMPQLKHLVLRRGSISPILANEEFSPSFSILHNLQTLHVVDLPLTVEVILRLPNLKKLKVKYGSRKHYQTNGINNLVYLHQLQVLNFELAELPYDLPNIYSFPRNLRKLTLRGSWIPLEKMFIVNSLPNLEVLKLMENSVEGGKWEITDEFPSLKHLEMESINLNEWIVESDHFPCLERLFIRECCYLKEVPESIGDIATLQILTIKRCNSGVEESARRIQEQQQSMQNDDLKVHIVPVPSETAY
ncbi:putative late blight resistance protein homolog R1A-10 [Primulina huaijiensis]|uniref:putative late blight resistance protein homolog R1A-10 n=1 Tax=Primulina huaijiensis TaxID=1492673 RepID=UPI003CC705EB